MNYEERQYKRMTQTPLTPLILSLSFPTVLGQLITSFYNLVDTYFVSNLGTTQSGAVSVSFSLMAIIQAAGFGLGMGSGSLISRSLGEKNEDAAHRHASSAFFASLLFGVLLMIPGILFTKKLMWLLGAKGSLITPAADYSRIILYGAPLMCASFVLNNVLRSQGKTISSMIGLGCGSVINIFLDYLFIRIFSMGVTGAALATVISQAISFLILLKLNFSKKSIVRISIRKIGKKASDYFLIIKTGLPTFFRQGLASFSTALLNNISAVITPNSAINEALVAAIGIATKIYIVIRSIVIGIGQGYQPLAGYNFGAKKFDRVKKSFWLVVSFATVFCLVATVVIFFASEPLMSFFIKDQDPEKQKMVVDLGKTALLFLAAELPFLAYSTITNQTLQVLGQSASATFLACCRQGVFYLPLILTLPKLFGVIGVQLTQPISDLLTFAVTIPLHLRFWRKLKNSN